MKTDLEILVLGLMLLRILTSLRLTKRTTVNEAQIQALNADAHALYMLAYLRVEEHNVSEKKNKFGSHFFFLYMVLTRIPYRLRNNVQEVPGLYCALLQSNEFWKTNGIFIFTGINKNKGMELLEEKRITTYRVLSLLLAMSHKPKDLNVKNAEAHIDKLMTQVFNYATGEHLELSQHDIAKALRTNAINSIYRMVDLIKQAATHTNAKGKNVLDDDNIAYIIQRPNYEDVTAVGHIMDVRLAKHLAQTEIHRVYDKQYK